MGKTTKAVIRIVYEAMADRGSTPLISTMKLDLSKIDVVEFLNELGMMKVRRDGNEVTFSCPFGLHMKGGAISMQVGTTICHCFGCGFSGNALTFLEELEGLSVDEAIKWLGERWDISRETSEKNFKNIIQKKLDSIQKTIDKPVKYKSYDPPIIDFKELDDREMDWDSIWIGWIDRFGKSRDIYYMFNRGLNLNSLKDWHIGWDELWQGFTIPYFDIEGNLLGFKARAVGDRQPKYKVLGGTQYGFEPMEVSETLFGINNFVPNENDIMIVCEGELNCISMHQDGFTNTVGISGRYVSDRQLQLIKRHCSTAIMVFDDFSDQRDVAIKLRDFVKVYVADDHDKDPADMTYSEKEELISSAYSGILL